VNKGRFLFSNENIMSLKKILKFIAQLICWFIIMGSLSMLGWWYWFWIVGILAKIF
jgi:hypothetical protein